MPRAAGPGLIAWPTTPPTAEERAAYRDAAALVLARPPAGPAAPTRRSTGDIEADLCIVGGGFTGLWAALHAKAGARREVVLVEAERDRRGGSGRNGGFVSSSITHGIANGLSRFPDEIETLERLGLENFDGMRRRHRAASASTATSRRAARSRSPSSRTRSTGSPRRRSCSPRYGHDVELLDRDAIRAEVDSPTYLGGRLGPDRLRRSSTPPSSPTASPPPRRSSVSTIHERTPGRPHSTMPAPACGRRSRPRRRGPRRARPARDERVPAAAAARSAATSSRSTTTCWSPSRSRRDSSAAIGWRNRQGISDTGNQFHYYRLTDDDRILWGGFEAVYRYGGPVDPRLDVDEETFAALVAALLRDLPAAPRPPLHPQVGRRDRHLQPLLRASSSSATAAGSPSSAATPASASAPPASAPRSPSTCSTAAGPRRRRSATCAPSRSRSRPSRCAGPSCSSPATGSRPPTATAAAAASGCGRSTGSGSASTAELRRRSALPDPAQERDQLVDEVVDVRRRPSSDRCGRRCSRGWPGSGSTPGSPTASASASAAAGTRSPPSAAPNA